MARTGGHSTAPHIRNPQLRCNRYTKAGGRLAATKPMRTAFSPMHSSCASGTGQCAREVNWWRAPSACRWRRNAPRRIAIVFSIGMDNSGMPLTMVLAFFRPKKTPVWSRCAASICRTRTPGNRCSSNLAKARSASTSTSRSLGTPRASRAWVKTPVPGPSSMMGSSNDRMSEVISAASEQLDGATTPTRRAGTTFFRRWTCFGLSWKWVLRSISHHVHWVVAISGGRRAAQRIPKLAVGNLAVPFMQPTPFGLRRKAEKRPTAASLIDDSSAQSNVANGPYVPQNDDRQFKGLVSARSATIVRHVTYVTLAVARRVAAHCAVAHGPRWHGVRWRSAPHAQSSAPGVCACGPGLPGHQATQACPCRAGAQCGDSGGVRAVVIVARRLSTRSDKKAAMQYLRDINRRNRSAGVACTPSVCSAHPQVLLASLLLAQSRQRTLLVEATSNQVNQFGGYTGMQAAHFIAHVQRIGQAHGIDRSLVLFGGDHLGPQVWRDQDAHSAMAHASALVASYVQAGFGKIHLDCSEGCAGEAAQVGDALSAQRAAQLARVCEQAARNPQALSYVVGTEV